MISGVPHRTGSGAVTKKLGVKILNEKEFLNIIK